MQRYHHDSELNIMIPHVFGDFVLYKDVTKLEEIANELVQALESVRLNSVAWHQHLSEDTKLKVANSLRKAGVV